MADPRFTGHIEIQNSAEYETALMAVERLLEVAEDSVTDPLDPLIELLIKAIQAWEANDPQLATRGREVPGEEETDYLLRSPVNRQHLDQSNAQVKHRLAEAPGKDPRTDVLFQLIQIAKRRGVTLGLLEAFDGLKLIERVQPWFKTEAAAVRWFLNQRLPAFGELTPAEVVQQHGDRGLNELLSYIEAKEQGGFE